MNEQELAWNEMKRLYERQQYEKLLSCQQESRAADSAGKNALAYYEGHQAMFDTALAYYQGFTEEGGRYILPPVTPPEKLPPEVASKPVILVVTANAIEQGVLLRYLAERFGGPLPSYWIDDVPYQILPLEKYTLVHTHTQDTGDEYARRAINHAYRILPKKSIRRLFLLGICYGVDFQRQKIGDVVISDNVLGYRINFRDDNALGTVFEPEKIFDKHPNAKLTGKLRSYATTYRICSKIPEEKNRHIPLYMGKFLSSDCLMSSREVKRAVVRTFSGANKKERPQGGEMECCGLFKSVLFETGKFNQWLVMKGICDWGEDKNSLCPGDEAKGSRIKDAFQAHAMLNVCEAFWQLQTGGIFETEEHHG